VEKLLIENEKGEKITVNKDVAQVLMTKGWKKASTTTYSTPPSEKTSKRKEGPGAKETPGASA
jgi:hypothetical protein